MTVDARLQQRRNTWELTIHKERAVLSRSPVKIWSIRCTSWEGETRVIAEFGLRGSQLVFDRINQEPMVYAPNGAFDGSIATFRLLALDKETPSKVELSVDWSLA